MSWPNVALGDVAAIQRDGVPPEAIKDGTRYLGLEHIESGGRIIGGEPVANGDLASTKFSFEPTDVLYGKLRPYLAKIALPEFSGVCSTDIVPIRPSMRLDRRYLAYFLRQPKIVELANSRATGANLPRLSPKELARIELPLPPLEEQKRIAAILDQADALRRLRARALDRLNALGQAIFHEMFGDPIGDRRNGAGWTTEALEKSIEFIDYRGKTPPKAAEGVRLITAKNVKMGFLNRDPEEFIEAAAFDGWMTRGFPQKGDVLFTTEAPLGNVAILDTNDKVAVGQRLITMQPDQARIDNIFLLYLLSSSGFRRKMFEYSTGSTVVGIKSSLLRKIEICYPSLPVQQRFSKAVEEVQRLKLISEGLLEKAVFLFASLQDQAFRERLPQ